MSDFGRNAIEKEIERAESKRDAIEATMIFEVFVVILITVGIISTGIAAKVFQFSATTIALIAFAIALPTAFIFVSLLACEATPLTLVRELREARARVRFLYTYYDDYCKAEQEEIQNEIQ